MFGKSVKILTLAIDKLSRHFIISKVTTKQQKQDHFPKIWKEKKIPHQSKRRQEKKMGQVNTQKKMAGIHPNISIITININGLNVP